MHRDQRNTLQYDISIKGVISQGFGHASGQRSQKYPEGTINLQKQHFPKHGLDISDCFSGTVNLDISPRTYRLVKPEFFLEGVIWKEGRIPENFFIARTVILSEGHAIDGFIYHPDLSTKTGSIDKPYHLQLLAPFIPNLKLGNSLEIKLRSSEIELL